MGSTPGQLPGGYEEFIRTAWFSLGLLHLTVLSVLPVRSLGNFLVTSSDTL